MDLKFINNTKVKIADKIKSEPFFTGYITMKGVHDHVQTTLNQILNSK